MNVLVIDYIGQSTQWLASYCKKETNILHIITPEEQYWTRFLEAREYDVILIFESGKRHLFDAMAELFKIPGERIIYVGDIASWMLHEWVVYALLNENSDLFKVTDFLMERNKRKYTVSNVGDLSYVGYSTDTAIMLEMYKTGENWAKLDMEIFHELATNLYSLEGRKYFLDLGANIGTTSIYFQKKIDHDIKVLAFEPDPETYKLLRANFILNEMPKDSILENYGLSDKAGDMILHRSSSNPGSNSIYENYNSYISHDNGDVSIQLVSLDDYLATKAIEPEEIKYIWIDTEGFEAQVLFGMRKLLQTQNLPIILEWNPGCYANAGVFNEFVELITGTFEGYVDTKEVKSGNVVIHKTTDLWNTKDCKEQTDIFLIK